MKETQIDSLVLKLSLCENELQASESWVGPGNEVNNLTHYRINRMFWEYGHFSAVVMWFTACILTKEITYILLTVI